MIKYYKNYDLKDLFYINKRGLICSEEWFDIPNYEKKYQISNLGRIKSLERKCFNKQNNSFSTYKPLIRRTSFEGGGYLQATLHKNNIATAFKVQKLMAMAFLGHVPCGYKEIVDHINNVRDDNRLENLQLITSRNNVSKDAKGISKYTGVCWDKKRECWRSHININKKYIYLIITKHEILAGKFYQLALENLDKYDGDNSKFRKLIKEILNIK